MPCSSPAATPRWASARPLNRRPKPWLPRCRVPFGWFPGRGTHGGARPWEARKSQPRFVGTKVHVGTLDWNRLSSWNLCHQQTAAGFATCGAGWMLRPLQAWSWKTPWVTWRRAAMDDRIVCCWLCIDWPQKGIHSGDGRVVVVDIVLVADWFRGSSRGS